jgi:hypothetical protein
MSLMSLKREPLILCDNYNKELKQNYKDIALGNNTIYYKVV